MNGVGLLGGPFQLGLNELFERVLHKSRQIQLAELEKEKAHVKQGIQEAKKINDNS